MTDLTDRPCVPLPSAVIRGSLEHGLLVCLGRLERNPDCFESAAVAWHARWCEEVPGARIPESRAVLAALEALGGADPTAGARVLRDLCQQEHLEGLTAVLDHWLEPQRHALAARPNDNHAACRNSLALSYPLATSSSG